EAEGGGGGALGDVDDDARLDVGDETEGEDLVAQEVVVGVHVGGDDAADIVDGAGDCHALDHFGPFADGLLELLQVFAAWELKLDVGHHFEVKPQLVIVEQGHAFCDDALFLHALDSPPAGAGGQADLFGDFGHGEGGVALDEVENLGVDCVKLCGHVFPPSV